jgi:hypothetical protein
MRLISTVALLVTALALAGLLASCGNTGSVSPDAKGEWYISARDAKIDLPESSYSEGNYRAEIVRQYKDEKELKLLRTAESTYPKRQRVEDAGATAPFRKPDEPPTGEDLWWVSSFDGVRIPYAITSAAVLYYYEQVRALGVRDAAIAGSKETHSCGMHYVGNVNHHEQFEVEGKSFPECYVVTMELKWSRRCGNVCGMWFTKKRTVVLDLKGDVLAVFQDGTADVAVS